MKKTVLLLLVALCAAAPARAEDAVLHFDIKAETKVTSIAPQQVSMKGVMTQEDIKNTEAKATLVLVPGKFSYRTGDDERIFDLGEKTEYIIDHAKKTWMAVPIHHIPVARAELRAVMAQRAIQFETTLNIGKYIMTNAGRVIDTRQHDLDLDTLYGSIGTTKTELGEMAHRGKEKAFTDPARGDLVRFETSDTRLPAALMKPYISFLVHIPTLHPTAEAALSASSAVFQWLWYRTDDHSGTQVETKWTLADQVLNKGVTLAEKPDGYKRIFTTDDQLNEAFNYGMKQGFKASDYGEQIKGYIGAGDGMRAMLKMHEMNLSLPASESTTQDKLTFSLMELTDSKDIQQAKMSVSERQTTQGGINLTNEYLLRTKKKYRDYVYFLDMFRARNIRGQLKLNADAGLQLDAKSLDKAQRMYANAIISNPWLATAYAELGDLNYDWADKSFAWLCWDQAIRLKPDIYYTPDLSYKTRVEHLKAEIEKDYPEYF